MTESNLDKLFEALRGITNRNRSESSQQKDESTGETYLIVGLGNPGKDYVDSRHNIGFMVVDQLAQQLEISFTRTQTQALVTDGQFNGHKIILAKPQTYMNKSGISVSGLVKFYKIPLENLLVAYDDVDLPFESIRMKPSGGSAGHRGMNSIFERLGTKEFPRLRLGVGRPPGHKQAANYVLKPFSKEESEFLEIFIQRAADAALAFIRDGIENAMTIYNRSTEGSPQDTKETKN